MVYRIAALNRGKTKVVIYDESTKKYSVMRDVSLDPSDKVISRLEAIFLSGNVILK